MLSHKMCIVGFYRIVKCISYAYISSFVLDFLPIKVPQSTWIEFPELFDRFSLVTSLYLVSIVCVCQSQSPNSSHLLLPQLKSICLFCMSVSLFLFCKSDNLYNFSRFSIQNIFNKCNYEGFPGFSEKTDKMACSFHTLRL